MNRCSEVWRFDGKKWGMHGCQLVNYPVQILMGKCIESSCSMGKDNALMVTYRIAVSENVSLFNGQLMLLTEPLPEGVEKILNNPWWDD